jgi:hypothetical protein
MTITAARPMTARYYASAGDRTIHFTTADFPEGELLFHGAGATIEGDTIVCEITPQVHMLLDRADVQVE